MIGMLPSTCKARNSRVGLELGHCLVCGGCREKAARWVGLTLAAPKGTRLHHMHGVVHAVQYNIPVAPFYPVLAVGRDATSYLQSQLLFFLKDFAEQGIRQIRDRQHRQTSHHSLSATRQQQHPA